MLALPFYEDAYENPARYETEDDCSRNWTCIGHLWHDLGVESRRSSGGEVFVQNSRHVIVRFMGSSAMFDNLLLLASPNSLDTIFEGHVAPPFTTVDLGIFSAGTELIFELNNQYGRIFLLAQAAATPTTLLTRLWTINLRRAKLSWDSRIFSAVVTLITMTFNSRCRMSEVRCRMAVALQRCC